jgi:predicted S18 family serine protease
MNAFEMADNLCVWAEDIYGGNIFFNNVANMLRQQADRIAELEKALQDGIKTFGEIQDQQLKDKFEKQSEPVAIVNTNCENNIQWNTLKPQSYNGYFLYTTPQDQADRIAELEKQLAFMEGEYPEPTIAEKMTEFEDLEQAYKRIAELEKQLKHWTTPCQPLCKPSVCDCIAPQTKPLSDEEIPSLLSAQVWRELPIEIKTHLVRAIEAKIRGEK